MQLVVALSLIVGGLWLAWAVLAGARLPWEAPPAPAARRGAQGAAGKAG